MVKLAWENGWGGTSYAHNTPDGGKYHTEEFNGRYHAYWRGPKTQKYIDLGSGSSKLHAQIICEVDYLSRYDA